MEEQLSFADEAESGPRRGEREIPKGARIDRCKSCQAEIIWVRTQDERAMPLSLATVQTRGGVAYALPHFSDCPEARQWSRKGKKQ